MKKKLPKISIITPSYNQGEFIERTINSVLEQKYSNLEFIVMDGGSTDSTIRILKKYDKYLTWVSEKDRGQAHAINKGLKKSTGDILAYLNSDDTYLPNALKTVAKHFTYNPKSHFVYGRGRLIDTDDREIGMYNDSQTNHELLFTQCAISQPAAFWTRKVFKSVGYFDESFQYTMDYEYWMRVSKQFELKYLPNHILANTRIHPQAKTSSQTHQLHRDAVRASLKHYGKVHYDWISTLADGEVAALNKETYFDHTRYLVHMIIKTFYYHAKFNHEFPTKPTRNLLLARIKQYFKTLL